MTSVLAAPPKRTWLIASSSSGSNGDLRELPQWQRRLEGRLAHDRAQARVGLLAAAVVREVAADDIIQRQRLRQRGRVDVQPRREFFRQPVLQEARAGLRLDLQQLGPHDGDDALFLDEVEQVVPDIVIERRGGKGRGGGFGSHGKKGAEV